MTPTALHLVRALSESCRGETPFRHWTLRDSLPTPVYASLRDLDPGPPPPAESAGRRETQNAHRLFFGAEACRRFQAAAELAAALQAPPTVAALEATTGAQLHGTSLRIEYCLDTDGFWLEPHTDIGAKKFTMLVYLSDLPGSDAWGTDLLDSAGNLVARPRAHPNSGLVFVPATDTWHGFTRRSIIGIRRSLIVNFVGPEWRARHELCFPDTPV